MLTASISDHGTVGMGQALGLAPLLPVRVVDVVVPVSRLHQGPVHEVVVVETGVVIIEFREVELGVTIARHHGEPVISKGLGRRLQVDDFVRFCRFSADEATSNGVQHRAPGCEVERHVIGQRPTNATRDDSLCSPVFDV